MKKADPISTEIIRNAFISIAQDMNAVLIRSAYTPVIYEGKDCVVARYWMKKVRCWDNHQGFLSF